MFRYFIVENKTVFVYFDEVSAFFTIIVIKIIYSPLKLLLDFEKESEFSENIFINY
jgi:hypothetical protein